MSKRKRSTPKDATPATPPEGGEGEPTVHVSSDMLAGSPDIFAPGKAQQAETPTAAESGEPEAESGEPEAMSSDVTPEEPPAPTEEMPVVAETEPAVAPPPPPPPPPPPTTYQPHPPAFAATTPAQRRVGSSVALGVVLVVLGLFALVVQVTGFDAGGSWPLFVLIPGLTLLVIGFISLGTGALIPGAILTVIGLILAYQNYSQDWTSWAFVWPLVAPGGVGLGVFLQGVRNRDAHLLRQGRVLMFVALLIFMIGFVIFGAVFDIGGVNYGWFGKAALPALLILVGIVLLARSVQRTRQT
jgi:hypothetical protein